MNALQEIGRFTTMVRAHFSLEQAPHVFIECGDRTFVRYKHSGRIAAQINALTPKEAEKAARTLKMAIAANDAAIQANAALSSAGNNEQRRGRLGGFKED